MSYSVKYTLAAGVTPFGHLVVHSVVPESARAAGLEAALEACTHLAHCCVRTVSAANAAAY